MSAFVAPFGIFHIHLLPAFSMKHGIHDFYLLDAAAHSTEVSPLSFLIASPNLPIAVSIGFVLFPICVLKSLVTVT